MKTGDPRLSALLESVKSGAISIDDAVEQLRILPYEDLGYARLDHHRKLRLGYPEVVFAQGKTTEQVANIMVRLAAQNERVLATRAVPEVYAAVRELLPDAIYHPIPRLIVIDRVTDETPMPGILVATGGTADMPVAEEAAITAELMGNQVVRLYDVGVAGIHRLARSHGVDPPGKSDRRCCRHGRRTGERCCGTGRRTGRRCSHQRRIWRQLWRFIGFAGNAQ